MEKIYKWALEVIYDKQVDLFTIDFCTSLDQYNEQVFEESKLTNIEFNLLKAVLDTIERR